MCELHKKYYQERLVGIMYKHNLVGGFIHQVYAAAITSGDFSNCYIDKTIKGCQSIRNDLNNLIDEYFIDNPNTKKPKCVS